MAGNQGFEVYVVLSTCGGGTNNASSSGTTTAPTTTTTTTLTATTATAGNASVCNGYNTQGNCTARPGCGWCNWSAIGNVVGQTCVAGTATGPVDYSQCCDSYVHRNGSGVVDSSAGTASYQTCYSTLSQQCWGERSSAVCNATSGCSWQAYCYNSGMDYCRIHVNSSVCVRQAGCNWDNSGYCHTSNSPCNTVGTIEACTAINGTANGTCAWFVGCSGSHNNGGGGEGNDVCMGACATQFAACQGDTVCGAAVQALGQALKNNGCQGHFQECVSANQPSVQAGLSLALYTAVTGCYFSCQGNASGMCPFGAGEGSPCVNPACFDATTTNASQTCCGAVGEYCRTNPCSSGAGLLTACGPVPASSSNCTSNPVIAGCDGGMSPSGCALTAGPVNSRESSPRMAVVDLTANTPYTLNVTYNGQMVVVTLLTGAIGNTGSALVTTSTAFNATAVWPGIVLGRNESAPTCFSKYVVQSSTGARTDYMQVEQVAQWADATGLGDSTGLSGAIRSGANPVCSGDHGVGLLPMQMAPFSVAVQWTSTGNILLSHVHIILIIIIIVIIILIFVEYIIWCHRGSCLFICLCLGVVLVAGASMMCVC